MLVGRHLTIGRLLIRWHALLIIWRLPIRRHTRIVLLRTTHTPGAPGTPRASRTTRASWTSHLVIWRLTVALTVALVVALTLLCPGVLWLSLLLRLAWLASPKIV